MVLQLHGLSVSACTRRVAVVARELGVPYELIHVDIRGREHKSDLFFTEKHPMGVIPAAFDDGLHIFESRAICRYLAAKYSETGGHLAPPPSDLERYAKFEAAASLEQNYFDRSAASIVHELVVKRRLGLGEPNRAIVDECVERLKVALDGYECILEKQRYIGGDTLTLVDLFHLPYGYEIGRNGIDIMTHYKPNVARWWNEISELESWKAVKDGA
ncbi:hypothetical protein BOTBODRAFT_36579 [Botryobasidium botryosum FD-172 SS1]|uniref:glutathione transferase n=1 Tax=Botryobasidium botryosum (strain FD-172 SS1) TaxID=930990 RepID=A0A067MEF5_BOTB1|nr:hypothetical protein BOTBODRAFT_36579 [Botryobasidium botryosum FD-172 SS1]